MLANKKVEEVYSVLLSGQAIQERLEQEIQKLALRQKVPGFRPGKVPLNVVFDMNEERVVSLVLDRLLTEKIRELDTHKALRHFAQLPGELRVEFGKPCDVPVELTFVYEPVVPEIDWSECVLPVLSTEIEDKDIQEITERYLKQMNRSEPLESPRPSQLGDILTIRVDIQDGQEERVSTFRLPLIEKELPSDLDVEDLINIDVGHVVTQRIKVPRFMSNVPLAGKKVIFTLAVEGIERSVSCGYDEESAQYVAQCDLATLSERIKTFIQLNIKTLTHKLQQEYVEARIMSLKDIDISQSLVRERSAELQKQYSNDHEFQTLVPEDQRDSWYTTVAHALLTQEFFMKHYATSYAQEITYEASDVLKVLENYASARRISHKEAVQRYMKDTNFSTWIQDWVRTQKILDHIVSRCKKDDTPAIKMISVWSDASSVLQSYQKLVGGRTEDIDLPAYIHAFSLKNINFSESHTTEDAQEIPSYGEAPHEEISEVASDV